MRKLSLDEIHDYGLGGLLYFDKICKKYDLRYSLAYGTLIGAIRHKGFIPWDDDIDVVMMRDDFEKLSEIFFRNIEQDEIYSFISEKNNKQYHYTLGRITDKQKSISYRMSVMWMKWEFLLIFIQSIMFLKIISQDLSLM